MVSFYNLFVNFMMIGLVIFSIFSFIVVTQDKNESSEKFLDNALIVANYQSLNTSLENLGNDSNSAKSVFESENPTAGFGSIILLSIVSSGKVFNAMFVGIFNTLIKLPVAFLGFNPILVSIFATLMGFTIILGLWIIYKLGG